MPRSRPILLVAALSVALPAALAAQSATPAARRSASDAAREARTPAPRGPSAPNDPELARAYALVIDGKGAQGRAVVDSLLAATPTSSTRYAETLYWRAAFAARSADAERDYRRLSVEFPLSARAADALIALAQLEYVRGDTTLAVHHLQRLMIEHPAGVRSARANAWAARVLFGAKDDVRACSALRAARATTGADDGELRNQIEEAVPRCSARPRVAAADAPAADAAPAAAAPAPTSDATAKPTTTPKPAPASAPRAATPAAAAPVAAPRAAPVAAPGAYAVQVAAYATRADAEALAAKLAARGYTARVSGAAAPFRVQVGPYATREAAAAGLERVRAAKLNGFVVATDGR